MDDIPSFARNRDGNAPPVRTLVLWSGGIDSTYTVWRLLTLEQRVVTLHVALESTDAASSDPRARFEARAIGRLRAAMAEQLDPSIAPPLHLQSACSLPGAIAQHSRASVLVFSAARAMVAQAFTPWDRLTFGVNGDVNPEWHPHSASCALRRLLTMRQLRAAMERDDVPRLALWQPRPNKADMLAALPSALARHVVSCAAPRRTDNAQFHVCGQCRKCRWRQSHQPTELQSSSSF